MQTGVQRTFAYVEFSDAASQEKAILLNGQVLKYIIFVLFRIYDKLIIIIIKYYFSVTLFEN